MVNSELHFTPLLFLKNCSGDKSVPILGTGP